MIRSFDLQVYKDLDGCSKAYLIGFKSLNGESNIYHLDSDMNHQDMVLKCVNEMLVPKYDNFTFYTDNFVSDSLVCFKVPVQNDKGDYNKRKMFTAIMPNVVHSLDRSAIAVLYELL